MKTKLHIIRDYLLEKLEYTKSLKKNPWLDRDRSGRGMFLKGMYEGEERTFQLLLNFINDITESEDYWTNSLPNKTSANPDRDLMINCIQELRERVRKLEENSKLL